MALAQLPAEIWLPGPVINLGDRLGIRSGAVLDTTGDTFGIWFQPSPQAIGKSLNKIGVNVNVVTASGDVDARLETVDQTNGEPTGTLATASANLVQAVNGTGWNEFALTAGHTVVSGDLTTGLFALFVAAATTNITIAETRRGMATAGVNMPYDIALIDPSAVFVKGTLGSGAQNQTIAVGYSDGTWEQIPGSAPFVTAGTDGVISTGAAEVGLEFEVPFACRLAAVAGSFDRNGLTAIHVGSASYLPGDTGGTRLSVIAIDPDVSFSTASEMEVIRLSTPVDLSANTTYRVVLVATEAVTSNLAFGTVDAAALLAAWGVPSVSPNVWTHIIDNEAGGWTTTATKTSMLSLGFDQFDDGAGGGGGGTKLVGSGGGMIG